MRCLVTAGPTYEKLDEVRRLTNFSTGRLGTELAAHLANAGHDVILLIGELATWRGHRIADEIQSFTTTSDLLNKLETHASDGIEAVFHAAAVSDFSFGGIFEKNAQGNLIELKEGKISTRGGDLLARLVPTSKLISRFRGFYPKAAIVGWKYELDGGRDAVLAKARQQIKENNTTACVANGGAYGEGFGIINAAGDHVHAASSLELYERLGQLIEN